MFSQMTLMENPENNFNEDLSKVFDFDGEVDLLSEILGFFQSLAEAGLLENYSDFVQARTRN